MKLVGVARSFESTNQCCDVLKVSNNGGELSLQNLAMVRCLKAQNLAKFWKSDMVSM